MILPLVTTDRDVHTDGPRVERLYLEIFGI